MPDWIAQLPPEEQPLLLACQELVDAGEARWLD